MAPSAPSARIDRGSIDSALALNNPIARPEDSQPARTSPVASDGTMTDTTTGTTTEDSHLEVAEAAPRAEALDAKWQSAIDAATD